MIINVLGTLCRAYAYLALLMFGLGLCGGAWLALAGVDVEGVARLLG